MYTLTLFISVIDNNGAQRSPKLLKSFMAQQSQGMNVKNPQKSEIQHFTKKNTNAVPISSNQMSKLYIQAAPHLSQVESSQSIKTSPIKNDVIGPKQYPKSIQKTQTQKTQKIKIGMHKKAVSLMGANQNVLFQQQDPNFYEYQKNQIQGAMNANSQKQSYVPSSQTSFNDYNSTHNQYQEIRSFPKVDNFLLQEKNGSLLLAQQQMQHQQHMKTFNKALQESQLSQQTLDQFAMTQDTGMKSFDQKPPLNQLHSSQQSQRLSIVSDTQQHQVNPGYRSHANSFKSSNNNIAMKHPPNKYIKGSTATTESHSNYNLNTQQNSQIKSKKTLQYHHQRTFSDNPSSFTQSKQHLFNANATDQVPNRNFQELIRSVNNKEQINGDFINTGVLQSSVNPTDIYPNSMVSISNQSNGMSKTNYAHKTTIGSSRQSAQSQVLMDDKDMGKHYQAQQETISDHLYNGQFKDQFSKTKQALKLTQQQFGGPSRKVVQSNKFSGNLNTQSYRMTGQHTLAGSTISSKVTFNNAMGFDPKSTPKLNIQKTQIVKSQIQSQNTSSQGARSSTNNTQINNQIHQSEKIRKQKPLNVNKHFDQTSSSINSVANLNFPSNPQIIIGSEIQKRATGQSFNTKKGSATTGNGVGAQISHKRSISDSNPGVFVSISNRGQQQFHDQLLKNQNNLGSQSQADFIKLNSNKITYSNQQSTAKLSQQPFYQKPGTGGSSSNEYQLISERQQYNQSTVIPSNNNNVVINSHRKIKLDSNTVKPQHQRHKSDQVVSNFDDSQDKIASKPQQKQTSIANQDKKYVYQNNQDMMIQDQSSNSQAHLFNQINSPQVHANPQMKALSIQQASLTVLKPVEERIETQESVASDPSLTPRSRMNYKLNRKIKIAFQKTSSLNSIGSFTTTTEFYKIGKVMGKGAFGKVNLAIHRLSNKFVALKSINKQFLSEEASKRKVMQEFNILRRTRHVNVVRLYESFETTQHIVFVMEVCGAGDLLTYVRRRRKLKEDVAKHLFKQIIEGLRYCHSKNILHRDIKLDNILLTSEGDIKICDFGVSKLVKPGEIMTEQCGTPAYIAPEVFENRGYEGYASDVWSAGVVLYAMLYGTVPFKANNMTELQKQITKCQTTFKDEISQESISLLKGILERDPSKRLKTFEILKHPWMQNLPEAVSVFTEQEKEKTIQEFAYYNFKGNNNNDNEIVHTDPFTEQMLNSTQNSLIKNASTKSVILAPFNSTRSHIDDQFYMRPSVQELLIDKKNIKFAAKVKEIDRQYEANNNAELDNGVYHQDSDEEEEEKKQQEEKKTDKKNKGDGSIETSFDKDDDQQFDEYGAEQIQKVSGNNNKENGKKKQSEWQKLEQMMIDRQKTEEDEEDNSKQRMNLVTAQTLVLDEKIIQEIEKTGFPKQYALNCLNNDELNYVTTYYYLLTTQKEF